MRFVFCMDGSVCISLLKQTENFMLAARRQLSRKRQLDASGYAVPGVHGKA
jgi:hypothetical protein